jgi:hypothetical protein
MLIKKRICSVLAVVFLLAINVSTVVAAPPMPIHIEALEWLGDSNPVPFIASGTAVNNGLVCAAGMVEDVSITWNNPAGPFQMLWVLKRFDCDDGSGTFDIKLVVKLDLATHNTTARWQIVGGTGQYAGLKGQGSLVGISNYPVTSILDIYDGKVH